MYAKKMILTLSVLLAVFSMSACSNNAENAENVNTSVQASDAPSPSPEAALSPEISPSPAGTPVVEAAGQSGEPGGLPEYLPEDFPMPDNAEITLAHSEDNEGKKSALLIFKTTDSMDSVSQLYKDYLSSRLGGEAAQTIDDNNLIIQGTTKDTKQSWSIIGGPLSAEQGVVELNVTWSEL